MSARSVGTAVFALVAMLVWMPIQADAQQEQFFIEGRGGVAFGLGDVGFLTDAGPTFGADIGYWVHDRVAFTVGGDATLLGGKSADFELPFPGSEATNDEGEEIAPAEVFTDIPDFTTLHVTAGLEILATERASPLSVRLGGGVGVSSITTDDFSSDFLAGIPDDVEAPEDSDFSTTRLALDARLLVGYDVSERFEVFAGARPYLTFTDEDETQFFRRAAERADTRGFGTAWTLPLHVGVNVGF